MYTVYATAPVGICSTYYYSYQNSYYCYTGGGVAVTGPGGGVAVAGPGGRVVVAGPGGGVAEAGPGGGVVKTLTGAAMHSYWGNVAPQYQYYNSPYDDYGYDWYAQRHLAYPQLY